MKKLEKSLSIIFCVVFLLGVAGMSVAAEEKIDINSANAEQLKKLSGIGDVIAARIIEYREANGPFKAPEGLMNVKGIGEKKFEVIKDKIVATQPAKKKK